MSNFISSFEFFLVYLILTSVLVLIVLFYKYRSKSFYSLQLKLAIISLIVILVILYVIISASNLNQTLLSLKSSDSVVYSNIFFIILCVSAYLFLSSLYEDNLYRSNEEMKDLKDNRVKNVISEEKYEVKELQFEPEYEYYEYENNLINPKCIEKSNEIDVKVNIIEEKNNSIEEEMKDMTNGNDKNDYIQNVRKDLEFDTEYEKEKEIMKVYDNNSKIASTTSNDDGFEELKDYINTLVKKERLSKAEDMEKEKQLAEVNVKESKKEEKTLNWNLDAKVKELKKEYQKRLELDDSIKILIRFKDQFLQDDVTLREAGIKPDENEIKVYLTDEDEEVFKRKILKNEKRDSREHGNREIDQIMG